MLLLRNVDRRHTAPWEGGRECAAAARSPGGIRVLLLRKCALPEQAVEALARALPAIPRLEVLQRRG